jgi:hypothetical protein
MTNQHDRPEHDKLEQVVDRALRELPLRRAPASLEARVLAAIEARGARAGWRSGFNYWPMAARALFILASIAFVKWTLEGVQWVLTAVNPGSVAAGAVSKVEWIRVLANAAVASIRSIPEEWLWGIAAIVTGIYAMFFALSAIAYRTLYVSRSR